MAKRNDQVMADKANRMNELAPAADMAAVLAELEALKAQNEALKAEQQVYASRITCDVSREEFARMAGPVTVEVAGQEFTATVRRDKGDGKSIGWYAGGKCQIQLGISGKFVDVQVGINLSVIGSKGLPARSSVPAANLPKPASQPAITPEILQALLASMKK